MCVCLLHYSVLFAFLVVFSLFSCIVFYRWWWIKMNILHITASLSLKRPFSGILQILPTIAFLLLQDWLLVFSGLFTDGPLHLSIGPIRFYFFNSFFLFSHFLVVGSVRYKKLIYVSFSAHVKIASRIVSYRSALLAFLQAYSAATLARLRKRPGKYSFRSLSISGSAPQWRGEQRPVWWVRAASDPIVTDYWMITE